MSCRLRNRPVRLLRRHPISPTARHHQTRNPARSRKLSGAKCAGQIPTTQPIGSLKSHYPVFRLPKCCLSGSLKTFSHLKTVHKKIFHLPP
ncbi:hypothetical protein GCWU000324_00024 [Kingella oralis ATCC 51147]|uniref:Uncharacterized protein n=1 Tax=Kingella oralis ATCC 51147 TaxID=629741 RepID=C4GEE1_9NEIS|nr:hypothetical protein GCWU000324_00024 [Kingella oralis ATCC 51147]